MQILGVRFPDRLVGRLSLGTAVGLVFGLVLGMWAGPRTSIPGYVLAGAVGWTLVAWWSPFFRTRWGAMAATAAAVTLATLAAWWAWDDPIFIGEIVFIGVIGAVGYGVLGWTYDHR